MFAKFGPLWGTIFGKGGPLLAAKIGPRDQFYYQNRSRGTNFGVTGQSVLVKYPTRHKDQISTMVIGDLTSQYICFKIEVQYVKCPRVG